MQLIASLFPLMKFFLMPQCKVNYSKNQGIQSLSLRSEQGIEALVWHKMVNSFLSLTDVIIGFTSIEFVYNVKFLIIV